MPSPDPSSSPPPTSTVDPPPGLIAPALRPAASPPATQVRVLFNPDRQGTEWGEGVVVVGRLNFDTAE